MVLRLENFLLASVWRPISRMIMICQLGKSHGLLQTSWQQHLPIAVASRPKERYFLQPTQMTSRSVVVIRPPHSARNGVGGISCGECFDTSSLRTLSRVSVAKEHGGSVAVGGGGDGILLPVLIRMLAAFLLLLDLSNAAAAFADVGGIVGTPDNNQGSGLDSLPTKPGLVERLVEKTKANKAKYDQERLDNYYRRNYKDYFDFLKGRLVNRDPETLTESERGILKWLEKNS